MFVNSWPPRSRKILRQAPQGFPGGFLLSKTTHLGTVNYGELLGLSAHPQFAPVS